MLSSVYKAYLSSSGILTFKCAYVSSLVALAGTHPSDLVILHTCVSTGNSCLFRQNISTQAMVFLPTPLNLSSSVLISSSVLLRKCSRLHSPLSSFKVLRIACKQGGCCLSVMRVPREETGHASSAVVRVCDYGCREPDALFSACVVTLVSNMLIDILQGARPALLECTSLRAEVGATSIVQDSQINN